MTIDFLIVGGGIGGAVLANLLSRQGKRVVVLERDPTPPKRTRPEVLWPATVEVLQSLIAKTHEETWRLPLAGIQVTEGERTLLDVTAETFAEIGVQPSSTDPGQTRRLLLAQGDFEVRPGVEVTDVLMDRDRVVGVRARQVANGSEQDLLANWTVADDGGRSIVRQRCGIQITPRFFPLELLVFGFDWPSKFPAATVQIRLNADRRQTRVIGVGAIPLPDQKGIGLLPVAPQRFCDEQRLQAGLSGFHQHDAIAAVVLEGQRFPQDFVHIRPAWGHASRYGVDGAVWIGDAVHPVTPAGGQGANMSVADAVTLADVVAHCQSRSEWVLNYEQRRRPANRRSIAISQRISQIISLPGFLLNRALPLAVRWFQHNPARLRWPLRFLSTAFQSEKKERGNERTSTEVGESAN